MSSAWESSLAKMSVFGTSVRSGKVSFNTRSRKVRTMSRIWSLATTFRSRSSASVADVLVGRFPAHLARLPVAIADHRAGPASMVEPCAVMLRADLVDLEVDVDAVGDGLLVRVLHDDVLVEEAVGVLGRRRRQADQVGVEVLEHLPPERVDGAVALVDEDDVEELRRDGAVVDDRQRLLHRRPGDSNSDAPRASGSSSGSPLSME